MAYFPLFTDLENKKVLIIGGGKVAERKIEKLLPFNPKITVIAPIVTKEMNNNEQLTIEKREYIEGDEDDFFVVIAATDNRKLNTIISHNCQNKRILVNVVDDKELCSFIFPSIVKEGKLTIGISTSGSSPTAAIEIKNKIRDFIPSSFDDILDYLYEQRKEIKKTVKIEEERHKILQNLFIEAMDKKRPLTRAESIMIRKQCDE